MTLEQIVIIALIQGITEFLPISSSGHLLLLPTLTGWQDQGLVTDVMVHVGSLLAVIVYFWRDVGRLIAGTFDLVRFRRTTYGQIALYILIATIPAVILGLALKFSGAADVFRQKDLVLQIVGWNAIIWGLLMYVGDRFGPRAHVMEDMRLPPALLIGLAQAAALIPGTSRSGATMTAARFLGFERTEAARFSFLLGIPAIAGAGLFTTLDAMESGEGIPPDALIAGALTFFAALAAIAFLMALVKRMSFLPFVIYRMMLGGLLLTLAYTGALAV